MPHAVIKLKMRMTIGEFEFTDDIVRFTSAWSLNAIPSATVQVAVGRNLKTGRLANIHTAIKQFKPQMPAAVYLTVTAQTEDGATSGLKVGQELKVFNGYLVGTGWQRGQNGANMTLHLLHWLSDLNNASAVSGSLHPGSPADLAYPAVFPAIGLNTTTPNSSSMPSWVPNLINSSVNAGSFEDLWSKVLLPWLRTLASDDPYDRALNGTGAPDPAVLAALGRLENSADSVPLAVDLQGVSGAVMADGLRTALISEIGSSWVNTTLWGKLIGEWAPAYWFSVVPRVDDALIVPFTGGLQGDPWSVLGDEDYVTADLRPQLTQVLRAVGIAYPVGSATGFDLNMGLPQVARGGLLGMYRPDNLTTGMVLLKDAPKWLSHPTVAHSLSYYAEGGDGAPIGNMLDEADVGNNRNPPRDFDTDISQLRSIVSAYAHQWYVLESLKSRTGEVSGKLRFDISPGSNVKIIAGGSKNVPLANELTEDLYATVVQVSYSIDAEGQQAGTAFSLAHVRTTYENTQPGTSIAKPPLYQQAWSGAKLISDAEGPEAAQ